MAARRLIIVLLVLFAISIAAAAVAPKRPGTLGSDDSTETSTESTTEEPAPVGGTVDAIVVASAEKPPVVEAGVGDQLALTVTSDVSIEVEIAELGLLAVATAEAPALFDILLREQGELAVTEAGTDEVVGRIVVAVGGERPSSPSRDRQSSAGGRSTP